MQDIRINFSGDTGTCVDLGSKVESKNLYAQKCLVNLATEQGTDPIYPDRGTTLLQGAIGGLAIGDNEAAHLGNFAALDTLAFVNEQEYSINSESPDLVTDMSVTAISYSQSSTLLSYAVQFTYVDGTETTEITEITTT